jgi:hypothetical protein
LDGVVREPRHDLLAGYIFIGLLPFVLGRSACSMGVPADAAVADPAAPRVSRRPQTVDPIEPVFSGGICDTPCIVDDH